MSARGAILYICHTKRGDLIDAAAFAYGALLFVMECCLGRSLVRHLVVRVMN